MADTATLPRRMTAEAFLAWAMEQPSGRYELHRGEVVRMPPETADHIRLKLELALLLREAARQLRPAAEAFTDGLGVRIDDRTLYEPDVTVRMGPSLAGHVSVITDPVVVAEVLSPSTQAVDRHDKLEGYFRLSSLQHYLIVSPWGRSVTHHARDGEDIRTRILHGGTLRLDPPGLTLDLDALFAVLVPD